MLFSFTLPISTIRKDVSPLTTRVRNIRSFNGCSSRALDKGTLLRSHLIVYVLTLYSVDPTSANSIISSSIIPTSSRLRSRDTKMRSFVCSRFWTVFLPKSLGSSEARWLLRTYLLLCMEFCFFDTLILNIYHFLLQVERSCKPCSEGVRRSLQFWEGLSRASSVSINNFWVILRLID